MANAQAAPLVEAQGLHKSYGATRAVADVSFSVNRGEVVGFLGPNGAGKTTTMQMLTGFLKPTMGRALIGGVDVAEEPLRARGMLGYLPENAPLYDDMMVVEFLRFIAELRGIRRDRISARLKEVCERCGLMNVLGKDIGHLSKGFRQRAGLAQALLHDPDLLILDEPTSGLDPNQIVEIRELIKDLGRDKTVILSTHILPEVQATCSRIIIIRDGKLVADDTPDALTDNEVGAVIRLVVKGKNGTDRDGIRTVLSGVPGVRGVDLADGDGMGTYGFKLHAMGDTDPREALFSTAVKQDWILLDMHRERVSLEDTFRRLTRKEESPRA